MEENKNDIDELVKSIDSSFKEMSLKDIVATHEAVSYTHLKIFGQMRVMH